MESATILIVDDDEAHRYTERVMLEKEGFTVQEASTGVDGLQAANTKPDLILLDVRLPDMTGFEVCRRLKATPATAAIPVVNITSAYPGADEKLDALDAGADGYLTRPVDPPLLIATVRALLLRKVA